MSQNKRFIALDGLGGNYSEIKDLGGGKVTHWYAATARRLGSDLDAAIARLRATWPSLPAD